MWKCCWILILCAAGVTSLLVEQNVSENLDVAVRRKNERNRYVRRFACPVGFFRLKGFCYYLSAGTAPWRDAYFHCKDRNATLAILDKPGRDRILRRYLTGDQFTKLERWIGGIFNWQQMRWEWGVTSEKLQYENFEKPASEKPEKPEYAWHCIVLDPTSGYRWAARICVERKHYVCQVPAGRISRRERKTAADQLAPQNQRLKPGKKGPKGNRLVGGKSGKRNGKRRNRPYEGEGKRWRGKWRERNPDEWWAHGVNLGSRPPSPPRKTRNRATANTTGTALANYPVVARILPQQRSAFSGSSDRQVQPLSDSRNGPAISQFNSNINDFAREEILLKP